MVLKDSFNFCSCHFSSCYKFPQFRLQNQSRDFFDSDYPSSNFKLPNCSTPRYPWLFPLPLQASAENFEVFQLLLRTSIETFESKKILTTDSDHSQQFVQLCPFTSSLLIRDFWLLFFNISCSHTLKRIFKDEI